VRLVVGVSLCVFLNRICISVDIKSNSRYDIMPMLHAQSTKCGNTGNSLDKLRHTRSVVWDSAAALSVPMWDPAPLR